jgi:hypothetical protein
MRFKIWRDIVRPSPVIGPDQPTIRIRVLCVRKSIPPKSPKLIKLIDHLFSDHSVQLSILPEFISFLNGRKRIIRIVSDSTEKPFDISLFRKNGFHVSETNLYCTSERNSFGCLTTTPLASLPKTEYKLVRMISISRQKEVLQEFQIAETVGDVEKAGFMLGYPECCVRNVEAINILSHKWATYYLDNYESASLASPYANRFPIAWGGISVVGELFPCSLNCIHAINYARAMMEDLVGLGFQRIHEVILNHSMRPVHIHPRSGSISVTPVSDSRPIIFS